MLQVNSWLQRICENFLASGFKDPLSYCQRLKKILLNILSNWFKLFYNGIRELGNSVFNNPKLIIYLGGAFLQSFFIAIMIAFKDFNDIRHVLFNPRRLLFLPRRVIAVLAETSLGLIFNIFFLTYARLSLESPMISRRLWALLLLHNYHLVLICRRTCGMSGQSRCQVTAKALDFVLKIGVHAGLVLVERRRCSGALMVDGLLQRQFHYWILR